jgi:hypothetical protein
MFGGGFWSAVVAALPFGLMLSTLGCILEYHWLIGQSIEELRSLGLVVPTTELLAKVDANEIPHALALCGFYLGIFLSAEGAFVLMAIREYLQDVLRLDERELLQGRIVVKDPAARPGTRGRKIMTHSVVADPSSAEARPTSGVLSA